MAAANTRQFVILGALLVVLMGVLAYRGRDLFGQAGATLMQASAASVGAAPAPSAGGGPAMTAEVNLGSLGASRPEPGDAGRNPFEFGQDRPVAADLPPSAAGPPRLTGPVDPAPAFGGNGPPAAPVAPITLKLIGIVEAPRGVGKLAVLSDGQHVYHGRVGEVVEGRYRIVAIREDSVQIEWADGRGRQTIRLSGS